MDIAPDYDVICLNETNLPHANISDLNLNGFQSIIRKDRNDRQGGGVGLYVANHLGVTRRQDLKLPGIELLWVVLKAGINKVLLGVCYRPPNSTRTFWDKLQDSLDLAKQSGFNDIIVAGDLNADFNTREGGKLKYFCNSNNMHLHINEPTRITNRSATVLDQFLSNCPELVTETKVLPPLSNCDHCVITTTLKFSNSFERKATYHRQIWLYSKADFSKFRNELSLADWESCFETDDPSISATKWTELFLNIAHRVLPYKNVLIRPHDKKFFNSELRRLRRKKLKKHHEAKTKNTTAAWDAFRQVRNEYNDLVDKCKRDAKQKELDSLKDPDLHPKKWWNIASSVLNKRSISVYPPLQAGGDLVTGSKEKAEVFNDHFISFSSLDNSDKNIPLEQPFLQASLDNIVLQQQEVLDLLKNLKTGKSPGPDSVTTKLLKEAGIGIVPSLTKLFNLSLSKGVFPQCWKQANVLPLHKKDDKSTITNYRPVSLLSCTSKIFEKAVFKHIYNYLRDNRLISIRQSGFIPGDSTICQLIHLYHMFADALDKKQDIRVVFCDISKAFDRVWHRGLLSKLHKNGISGNLLTWFENYLQERKQRVVIDGQSSAYQTVPAGVPQGSVLGPLLFFIYINDITSVVNSEIRLFADDTTLYVTVDNDPTAAAQVLNKDLENMSRWADQWLVKFSPPKTETLYITKKKKKLQKPPLSMDGQLIREVKSHKHLGVTLSNDLSWNEHITNISASANRLLDVLNAFKYSLDRKSLERIYFSYVRPKLEYGAALWDNIPDYLVDLLEQVQIRAAKIICGATNRTSHALIYQEIGWESLEERRKHLRLVLMYKIKNDLAPRYLQDALPEPADHQYNLRHSQAQENFRSRTENFNNSYFPKTIRQWNLLPGDVQHAPSVSSFKSKIKDTKHKPPDWFYHGDRKAGIIHARLRLLCSSLNDHLFSQLHVIDDPNCICGNLRETTRHYLLDCPLYHTERQAMLLALNNLGFEATLPNILYGNDSFTCDVNKKAFEAIHTFILGSGRFKPQSHVVNFLAR